MNTHGKLAQQSRDTGIAEKFRRAVTHNCLIVVLALLPSMSALADTAGVLSERSIHSDSIDALCTTGDSVVSASFDGTIKRVSSGTIENVGAHRDWVRGLLCIDDAIVSASNDGRIVIWKGASVVNQIDAHDWWITDIAFHDNRIISVSLDESVKIWSFPALEPVYQHKIYGSFKHMTVAVCQNRVFVGSTFGISVLNLSTFKWIYQNKAFDKYNVFLSSAASADVVYFGDDNGKVFRFNASTADLISSATVSRTAIKALAYHEKKLFVGDDDGIVQIVDAESLKSDKVMTHHTQSVRVLRVWGNRLYAGYDGGILRVIRVP